MILSIYGQGALFGLRQFMRIAPLICAVESIELGHLRFGERKIDMSILRNVLGIT